MTTQQMDETPDWLIECTRVLQEVFDERKRQHAKWGEQNPPDGTGGPGTLYARSAAQGDCRTAFDMGRGTWLHILQEEVHEAFAEKNLDRLRAELIQVAAVAVQWIECLDRRRG